MKSFVKAGAALGAAALALTFAASPASADPGAVRPLAGVGSDTTQDVLNGLSTVIADDVTGNLLVGSYDARGTSPIQTRSSGCVFPRPNGSGQGRQALRASEGEGGGVFMGVNVTGCVDFARSSSYPDPANPVSDGNYTYIPFGVDAVTYTINEASDLPDNLTLQQLRDIYHCDQEDVDGVPVTPLLIQSGSGTRQFWLQQMGLAESQIPALLKRNGGCLEDLNDTVQEHDGTVLAGHTEYILPFSVGQFLAQLHNDEIEDETGVVVVDRRGPAFLGRINGTNPTIDWPVDEDSVLNPNFTVTRDVYNVVPTADLGSPNIAEAFVGPGSDACENQSLVQLFGFGFRSIAVDLLHNSCGATDLRHNT